MCALFTDGVRIAHSIANAVLAAKYCGTNATSGIVASVRLPQKRSQFHGSTPLHACRARTRSRVDYILLVLVLSRHLRRTISWQGLVEHCLFHTLRPGITSRGLWKHSNASRRGSCFHISTWPGGICHPDQRSLSISSHLDQGASVETNKSNNSLVISLTSSDLQGPHHIVYHLTRNPLPLLFECHAKGPSTSEDEYSLSAAESFDSSIAESKSHPYLEARRSLLCEQPAFGHPKLHVFLLPQ